MFSANLLQAVLPIYTGAPGWEVYATGIDYDIGSGGPPLSSTGPSINTQIGIANNTSGGPGTSVGWVGVSGGANGNLAVGSTNTPPTSPNPFPAVCGIDPAAQWMWYNARPGVLNAFTNSLAPNNGGGSTVGNGGHREYLIFRIPVRSLVTVDPRDYGPGPTHTPDFTRYTVACHIDGEVHDLCDLGRDPQGNQIYAFTAPLSLSNADSCDLSVKMPSGAVTVSYGPTTLSSGTTQVSGTFTVPPSVTGQFCFELECKNGALGSCGKEVCVNLPPRALGVGETAVKDHHPQATTTSNRHLDVSRFEVGAQFTSLNTRQNLQTQPGVGGRLTYNVLDSLAFEAEANFFPREGFSSEFDGGRVTQAFVGIKTGRRFESFEVFGTVKPGVQSFSRAVTGYRFDHEILTGVDVGRKNLFALNLGGGVELCPASRVGVRFGVGDTVTFHPGRESLGPHSPVRVPRFTEHNFQFSSGLSYRF